MVMAIEGFPGTAGAAREVRGPKYDGEALFDRMITVRGGLITHSHIPPI